MAWPSRYCVVGRQSYVGGNTCTKFELDRLNGWWDITVFINCEIYRSLSPLNRKWRHWSLHACKNYCVSMYLQSFSLIEKVLFEICVFLYLMSNWPCDLDLWSRSLFKWSWCDTILGLTNPQNFRKIRPIDFAPARVTHFWLHTHTDTHRDTHTHTHTHPEFRLVPVRSYNSHSCMEWD